MELSCNCVRSQLYSIYNTLHDCKFGHFRVVNNTDELFASSLHWGRNAVGKAGRRGWWADTVARQFHPLKQKRFARKTDNPGWLKQKQDPWKAHFSPSSGLRGNLSVNYLEEDNAITCGRQFCVPILQGRKASKWPFSWHRCHQKIRVEDVFAYLMKRKIHTPFNFHTPYNFHTPMSTP
jgi:hypothetical protein